MKIQPLSIPDTMKHVRPQLPGQFSFQTLINNEKIATEYALMKPTAHRHHPLPPHLPHTVGGSSTCEVAVSYMGAQLRDQHRPTRRRAGQPPSPSWAAQDRRHEKGNRPVAEKSKNT
jgi:hypothetical protein